MCNLVENIRHFKGRFWTLLGRIALNRLKQGGTTPSSLFIARLRSPLRILEGEWT